MRITVEQREALAPYLTTLKGGRVFPPGRKPPSAAFALVAALVDPKDIEATIVEVGTGGGRTTWTIYVLTNRLLAHIRLGFASDHYDEAEERDQLTHHSKATTDIQHSTVIRLKDIVKFEFISYPEEEKIQVDQIASGSFPMPRMKLTAEDGSELYLPGERGKKEEELEESEKFRALLRTHLPS